MKEVTVFILENKYTILTALFSFIAQFLCATKLLKNKRSDFSYSGHTFSWYEGSLKEFSYLVLGFAVGVAIFVVCIIYLIVIVNN